MGITTDLIQQLNRTFVSQRAEKDFYRKKKQEFKNYLTEKFYAKFAENEGNPPDNVYSYFIQTEIQTDIIKHFNDLDLATRLDTYNTILKKIYNQFKTNFKMNYSLENIEKEEAKQQKELEKLKLQYAKLYLENQQLEAERERIKQRGKKKIILGLFVAGRLASKRYKKMKY